MFVTFPFTKQSQSESELSISGWFLLIEAGMLQCQERRGEERRVVSGYLSDKKWEGGREAVVGSVTC